MTDRPNLEPGQATADRDAVNAELERLYNQPVELEQPLHFIHKHGQQQDEAEPKTGVKPEDLKPVEDDPKPKLEKPLPFLPEAKKGGAPPWVKLPEGLLLPEGRIVYFLRIRAHLTNTPRKGDRQCICWSLGVGDKRIAYGRSMGDRNRASDELVKATIRVIDGEMVDLANSRLDIWWDEISEKGRTLLDRVFGQLHYPKPEDIDDFLKNCIEARSAE